MVWSQPTGSAVNVRIEKISAGTTERIELSGGAFALEQAYWTKPRDEGRWESHRLYIDLQVLVAGEEFMEAVHAGRLVVAEDLTPGKDLIFYQPFSAGSTLRIRAGEVAVFFPVDAHLPSLRVGADPALVRKTVVKVPVFA